MNRTVPDWAIQTCWWFSGIFATGALWYFLSIKNYSYVAGSGALAVAFALAAIVLHRRKDQLYEKSLPTEFKDEIPDDYVRRSLDEPTDLRLFQALHEIKAIAYRTAQLGWDTGITVEMRELAVVAQPVLQFGDVFQLDRCAVAIDHDHFRQVA